MRCGEPKPEAGEKGRGVALRCVRDLQELSRPVVGRPGKNKLSRPLTVLRVAAAGLVAGRNWTDSWGCMRGELQVGRLGAPARPFSLGGGVFVVESHSLLFHAAPAACRPSWTGPRGRSLQPVRDQKGELGR